MSNARGASSLARVHHPQQMWKEGWAVSGFPLKACEARARGSLEIITEEDILHDNWPQGSTQFRQTKQSERCCFFHQEKTCLECSFILLYFTSMLNCLCSTSTLKCNTVFNFVLPLTTIFFLLFISTFFFLCTSCSISSIVLPHLSSTFSTLFPHTCPAMSSPRSPIFSPSASSARLCTALLYTALLSSPPPPLLCSALLSSSLLSSPLTPLVITACSCCDKPLLDLFLSLFWQVFACFMCTSWERDCVCVNMCVSFVCVGVSVCLHVWD